MAAAAAGPASARMHPLTLRFGSEELEREIRAASHHKICVLSAILAGSSLVLPVSMYLQGRHMVWTLVLTAGFCGLCTETHRLEPYSAHRFFEWGLRVLLICAMVVHIATGVVGTASAVDVGDVCNRTAAPGGTDEFIDADAVSWARPENTHKCIVASKNIETLLPPSWALLANLFFGISVCISNCWLHMGFSTKILTVATALSAHAAVPMYPELGGRLDELRILSLTMCFGLILGYGLERTARVGFLSFKEKENLQVQLMHKAAEAESARTRAAAHRLINHTSKRVMCNMVHVCSTVIQRLKERHLEKATEDLINLLNVHSSESISGFHMCQSVLLRASMSARAYQPQLVTFSLQELVDELGFTSNERVICNLQCGDLVIFADKVSLQTVLFNAWHNAMMHGREDGVINVRAQLDGDSLCILVINEPGLNHGCLLKLGCAPPVPYLMVVAATAAESEEVSRSQDWSVV